MFEKFDKVFFKNTKTEVYRDDNGEATMLRISPEEGYVIHHKLRDVVVYDTDTSEETGEVIKGYTALYVTVGNDYDFEANPFDIYVVRKEDAE